MKFKDRVSSLEGKKVSILIDIVKEDGSSKENYKGILEEVGDDFIVLNPNNPSFFIKKLYIKIDLILSVWELK